MRKAGTKIKDHERYMMIMMYTHMTGQDTPNFKWIARKIGCNTDTVRKTIRRYQSTEKAGRPSGPGEGFRGCVELDGTFTPYPTIDHMLAAGQDARGLTGRAEQLKVKKLNRKRLAA